MDFCPVADNSFLVTHTFVDITDDTQTQSNLRSEDFGDNKPMTALMLSEPTLNV